MSVFVSIALERRPSIDAIGGCAHPISGVGRILTPRGRCHLSVETFRRDVDGGTWRIVEDAHEALAVLGRELRFDLDLVAEPSREPRTSGAQSRDPSARTVVQSYVLARPDAGDRPQP